MPDLPTPSSWLSILLYVVGGGLVGNLVKPLIDLRSRSAEAKATAAAAAARAAVDDATKLRDDMLEYAVEVRAENATLKQQYEELRVTYVSTLNGLIDFRAFVLAEGGKALYHNDRKEHEEVAKHLDYLMGGARNLKVGPFGGGNVPKERNGR